jgi:hypothetical protein
MGIALSNVAFKGIQPQQKTQYTHNNQNTFLGSKLKPLSQDTVSFKGPLTKGEIKEALDAAIARLRSETNPAKIKSIRQTIDTLQKALRSASIV